MNEWRNDILAPNCWVIVSAIRPISCTKLYYLIFIWLKAPKETIWYSTHLLSYSALIGFWLWQEAEPMYGSLTMNTGDPHPGSLVNSGKGWYNGLKVVMNLLTLLLGIYLGVYVHSPWIWVCSATALAYRIPWEWCCTDIWVQSIRDTFYFWEHTLLEPFATM